MHPTFRCISCTLLFGAFHAPYFSVHFMHPTFRCISCTLLFGAFWHLTFWRYASMMTLADRSSLELFSGWDGAAEVSRRRHVVKALEEAAGDDEMLALA